MAFSGAGGGASGAAAARGGGQRGRGQDGGGGRRWRGWWVVAAGVTCLGVDVDVRPWSPRRRSLVAMPDAMSAPHQPPWSRCNRPGLPGRGVAGGVFFSPGGEAAASFRAGRRRRGGQRGGAVQRFKDDGAGLLLLTRCGACAVCGAAVVHAVRRGADVSSAQGRAAAEREEQPQTPNPKHNPKCLPRRQVGVFGTGTTWNE